MNRLLIIVLACLGAFLYVRSPIDLLPDGMGLLGVLDDLVVAFFIVWWLRKRLSVPSRPRTTARQRARGQAGFAGSGPRGESRGAADDTPPAWDPYAVLGIARGATADEISRAYRAQMKLYHPDRVADLGPELQEVAHRKAIDIQRAYEELGAG
jgi:uncharacterized membrane protein YkvA (DUF1232 family)